MSDPPNTEKASQPAEHPWQRFTLLDALLLQAGLAMGFSAMHFAVGPWRSARHAVDRVGWVLAGTLLGAILAGPLVLGVQRLFRGRRRALSPGEWIWLWHSAPVFLALLAFALQYILPEEVLFLVIFMPGSILVSLMPVVPIVSLLLLLERNVRPGDIPCRWSDRFGLIVGLGIGLLLIFVVVAVMVSVATFG